MEFCLSEPRAGSDAALPFVDSVSTNIEKGGEVVPIQKARRGSRHGEIQQFENPRGTDIRGTESPRRDREELASFSDAPRMSRSSA